MSRPLDNIIALQKHRDTQRDLESRLDGIPDWMQELHDEHSERQAEIDGLESQVEEARSVRRAAEGSISDHQTKLARYQQQINSVTNQREYAALLQEIDTAKQAIADLEAQALSNLEVVETAQAALEEKRTPFEELAKRYKEEEERWEAEKPGLKKELARILAEIETLRAAIPRAYVALFDRIAERLGGQATASIRRLDPLGKRQTVWHCVVCNYNVRPQIVFESQSGTLHQCESCKRILFVEEAEEESAEEA